MRDPNCQRCVLHKTAQHVCLLGKGLQPCDIAVVGEAPGQREDDEGELFVGKSGQLLDELLENAGIPRHRVFITNAVSCRPPDNRTPRKGEINACRYWLNKQLGKTKPKFILLLGNVALQGVLGITGIAKLRGRPIERDGIWYMPTFHPSAILHDPRKEAKLEADIAYFAELVKHDGIPKEPGLNWTIVDTISKFHHFLDHLFGCVSFDLETTCLYPWAPEADIVSLGFGTRGTQWIIPWGGIRNHGKCWTKAQRRYILRQLDRKIRDCIVVAQSGKFDALWMWVRHKLKWKIDFDTMLAHYILDENSPHDLNYLSKIFFGAFDYDIPLAEKQGDAPIEKIAEYQGKDLFYTRGLKYILSKKLAKDPEVKDVFYKILMPCVELFLEAEYHGFYIDTDNMDIAEKALRIKLKGAERRLKKWGRDVNWASPDQLAKVLFEDLKIKPIEKTAGGKNSTKESVLKQIDHPIVRDILKHREASKQLSSFIEGWKPFLINKRLHPSFKLHGTVTGRPSCEHPNMQQVPRDETIRSLITAPPGWVLVEADLSQIELRIAAELANERTMLYAFNNGIDIHWLTAIREIARGAGQAVLVKKTAKTYLKKRVNYADSIQALIKMGPDIAIEIDKRWKELRKKAKAINFGYLYGMWWKKFKIYARDNYDVIVDDKQAEASRTAYFDLYSDLPEWHRRQKAYARRNGYVRSLSGRKRRLPDAMDQHDSGFRQRAERQAINSPVQSFASELNLMAAIQMRQEFSPDTLRIVGTVHDSILMEVKEGYVEQAARRIKEIMRHPKLMDELDILISVPIEADVVIGPWSKGKGIDKWLEIKNAA